MQTQAPMNSQQELGDGNEYLQAKTRFVEIDGHRIAYRSVGPKRAVPVLLIQRFRGTMDDWDPAFIDAMVARGHQVIVFNGRGVSTSEGEAHDTVEGMAHGVAALAKALGLPRVDVLGWSMGGFVAQVLPLLEPQLVRRVILVGTGPGKGPGVVLPGKEVFEVATRPRFGIEEHQYLFFAQATESERLREASLARIGARTGATEPEVPPEVVERQGQAIMAFLGNEGRWHERLGELRHPVLIVMGDRDAFFHASNGAVLFERLPQARLAVLPMAGHGPHHQHPEAVARMVAGFLSDPIRVDL